MISMICQATVGMERLLSELTEYARPLRLRLQPTDIAGLVADVCKFYRLAYAQKLVTLTWTDPKTLLETLEIDADALRQALLNLLKNALEASPAGRTVSVDISRQRQHESYLTITVSDEGCGVPAGDLEKLFTPYFSTKAHGSGLGLSHSRNLLRAHGGDVALLSGASGKGAVFALILPCPANDTY